MIIGVDLDDVLADFFSVYLMFYNEKYETNFRKEDFVRWDFPGICGITFEESIARLSEFVKTGSNKNIIPIPNAQEMIARLAQQHTLHIITSRPLDIVEETAQWVERHFSKLFCDIHFCSMDGGMVHFRSKSSVCQEIGAKLLIDDHPENAQSCAEDGIQVYLFDQPWNQEVKTSTKVVRMFSWEDKIIEDLCY